MLLSCHFEYDFLLALGFFPFFDTQCLIWLCTSCELMADTSLCVVTVTLDPEWLKCQ